MRGFGAVQLPTECTHDVLDAMMPYMPRQQSAFVQYRSIPAHTIAPKLVPKGSSRDHVMDVSEVCEKKSKASLKKSSGSRKVEQRVDHVKKKRAEKQESKRKKQQEM